VAEQVGNPLAIVDIRLAARYGLDMAGVRQQQLEAILEQVVVGSGRGAVQAFQPARFLAPPSEPDVRVGPVSGSPRISFGYVVALAIVTHGEGIVAPR
jgi:hypothetical protein